MNNLTATLTAQPVSTPTTKTTTYRPDIDGLRGIAVSFVFLYHLFPTYFKGGFIGVDIFFVISGFLITSIIYSLVSTQRFSFFDFYIRRIRRIFPALIITCALFLGYGYFVLFPDEFRHLGKHISSAAVFLSNLTLYREVGYFDVRATSKPLLHLWSLAVEEQFYLFWPLTLLILYRITSLARFVKHKTLLLTLAILSLTIMSYALNFYLPLHRKNLAFYFTGARLWEMTLGALIAVNLTQIKKLFETASQNKTFGTLQFALLGIILGALFFLDIHNPYFYLFLPIALVSTTILILLPAINSQFSNPLLSSRLLVGIGLISYPMYLLHWPFITFVRLITGQPPSLDMKIFIISIVCILSYGIYKFVETPIRQSKSIFVPVILLLTLLILGAIGLAIKNQYIEPYLTHKIPASIPVTQAFNEWGYPTPHMKNFTYQNEIYRKLGNTNDLVLFFGDSNVEQYAPRIEKIIEQNHSKKSAIFATWGGLCPMPNVGRTSHEQHFAEKVMQYAARPEIKTIVIAGAWYGYLSGSAKRYRYLEQGDFTDKRYIQKAVDDLKHALLSLRAQGKEIYIVTAIPSGAAYDPKHFFQRDFFANWQFNPKQASKSSWINRTRERKQILLDLAAATDAQIIDPEVFLCDESICKTYVNHLMPLHKDSGHLRPTFVKNHLTFLDFLFKA